MTAWHFLGGMAISALIPSIMGLLYIRGLAGRQDAHEAVCAERWRQVWLVITELKDILHATMTPQAVAALENRVTEVEHLALRTDQFATEINFGLPPDTRAKRSRS